MYISIQDIHGYSVFWFQDIVVARKQTMLDKVKIVRNSSCILLFAMFMHHMEASIAWPTCFEYVHRSSAILDHLCNHVCLILVLNPSQVRNREWKPGRVPRSTLGEF